MDKKVLDKMIRGLAKFNCYIYRFINFNQNIYCVLI